MTLGLRIDVDTILGLARGVPALLSILDELNIKATFFVPMGPDRMGRNAKKILSREGLGTSLVPYLRTYQWQMLLNGTLRSAPSFADTGAAMMLRIRREGHDVGLHSFDHYGWQNGVAEYSDSDIAKDFRKSMLSFSQVFGSLPACCAAPGWRVTRRSLSVQESFGFRYASDTRGYCPFYPSLGGTRLSTLQIPVTLPTMDEVLLQGGDSFDLPDSGEHVYCAHAEIEGLRRLERFRALLRKALDDGANIVTLGDLARRASGAPPVGIREGRVPGRVSLVSLQANP